MNCSHPCANRGDSDASCRMLRFALAYAARGWPVFGCPSGEDKTAAKYRCNATTERQTIVARWVEEPGALIGTPLGAESGLVVVLLRKGADGLDGEETFANLGETVHTRTHRTPKGYRQHFFVHPGQPVRFKVLDKGVEVWGDNGQNNYALLPPSTTIDGAFAVESEVDPAPLPAWLLELFREKGCFAKPDPVDPPPPLTSACYEGGVVSVDEAPLDAPLPWGDAYPLGGSSERPPPWPWMVFPRALRGMGEAIERTFNVSPEMSGAAVLGITSIALANKARVELKRDHRQFANLYLLVVANVAEGKTPVTRAAQAPLIDWQRERRVEWQSKCRAWDAHKNIADAQIRGLEEQAKRSATRKQDGAFDPAKSERQIEELRSRIGERPAEPVLFCADATSEALGRRMYEHDGAIGVLSGEARKILSIARGRYVEGGDIDLWLAGHGGDYIRVDRSARDKPSYDIREACIAAVIMTQPDSIQSLGECEALRESGFLARWFYLVPDHNRGGYPVESIPDEVAADYARTIRGLLNFPLAISDDGTPAARVATLHESAFERWRLFHDLNSREISETRETKPGSYLQWLGKLPEHVARLALLFHVCNHIEGCEFGLIPLQTVEDAIQMAEALKVHSRRAFALMGGDFDTARARKVWSWLNKNREKLRGWRANDNLPAIEAVKPRDLERAEVAGIRNSEEAKTVLMLLAAKGYLQTVDVRPPVGKAQRLFYLRPLTPCFVESTHPTNPTNPTNPT